MRKYIKQIYITIVITLILVPISSHAQSRDTIRSKKHTTIYDNKLEVIYDEDNGEYSGVKVNRKPVDDDEHTRLYRPMMILPPPEMEDNDAELEPMLYQGITDEGVESEDDILLAAGDSTLVHIRAMDLANFRDTTLILVNPAMGHKFVFPTPARAVVTSHFGARKRRWHYGLDLGLPTGEPIYAAFDGVVRFSNWNSSYGNLIVIRHNNGLETYYAHLSKRNVHAGDHVKAGTTIGLCGNTGRSYGSHLHFEIRYRGIAMNPEHVVDPTTRTLRSEKLQLTRQSFAKVGSSSTGRTTSHSTASRSSSQYYKVRQGDTLSRIAKRNGTTVKRLCQLNGIKETSTLRIGQRLRVR